MEDGNLLDFGQTGVIAVNHVIYKFVGEKRIIFEKIHTFLIKEKHI
jgi:hypothetical protein